MGHKTHPFGFRLGIIKDWRTHWYANNGAQYRAGVQQDLSCAAPSMTSTAPFPTPASPRSRSTARPRKPSSTSTRPGPAS